MRPYFMRAALAAVFTLPFVGLPVVVADEVAVTDEADVAIELDKVDAWLGSWADAGFLSGCVLVADGDEVVYERCFGDANAELGVPNTPDTRFAIASITKALQQVLYARLIDAGALTIDDPISRWIDGFPDGDAITVHQIANHKGRIPHRVTESRDEIFARTAADMVELVMEDGLLEETGESVYSSAGYSVMARILELAGDASWERLMQREVFDPAGMASTIHPSERRLIPNRASSYEWTPEGYRLTEPKDLSFLVGAGSLYSTPRDLFRYMRAVLRGTYGATAQEYLLDEGSLGSNGLTNGYRAYADYNAETDVSLVLCANVVTGALERMREAVPAVFAGGEIPEIELPDVASMKSGGEDLTLYEGSYELRPGRELGVRAKGDRLDVDSWMLLPLGPPHAFFCVQDFSQVVFEFDEDGAATGLQWGDHPMTRMGDVE